MQTARKMLLPLTPGAAHAVFLDIDGTLLQLAPTPDTVYVPPELLRLLQRLSGKAGGAIAFVSGRSIRSIDTLFEPLVLPAVGLHGGEIRNSSGELTLDRQSQARLQTIEPALRRSLARLPGVELENKGGAIALHYRAVPERARDALQAAQMAVASLGSEFGLLSGKCVVEIRPRHANKGAGIERLMQEAPFRGRTPIFAGDDVTDEDGFDVVNRLGGISIHVGEGAATRARYRLASPEALHGWLQQI